MKKVFKKGVLLASLIGCICLGKSTIYATDATNEVEGNNTMQEANTILANSETGAGVSKGQYYGQHTVNGSTCKGDEDWFKVYLTKGENYITCNATSLEYSVYDSNDTIVTSGSHVGAGAKYGIRAYKFIADTSGYYYVKLEGSYSSEVDYIMLIGSPTYSVASYTRDMGRIYMDGSDETRSFDLTYNSVIPDKAIIYSISVGGSSAKVEDIIVENEKTGKSITLRPYGWSQSNIESLKIPAKSGWTITYTPFSSRSKSFTSEFRISYVYPVTSTMVND